MKLLTIGILTLTLICGGCVSVGSNFDMAAVDQLQPGMTIAEVTTRLGQPNAQSIMANGGQVLVWLHSQGNALGEGQARSVSIVFDANGRMTNQISRTQAQIN